MDIVSLLISFNKISLVALIVIIGFLSYQIYLLKKETDNKKKTLVVPDFKENSSSTPIQSTIVISQEKKTYTKSSRIPIIIGFVLFVIFGLIFIFGLLESKSQNARKSQNLNPTPIVNFVASKGIRIYNQNWQELSDEMVKKTQAGEQHIMVGIERVNDPNVDMARIRINKNQWDQADITIQFNKQMNVFFKDYVISTGAAFLKVEAQLHSKTDGWLGN